MSTLAIVGAGAKAVAVAAKASVLRDMGVEVPDVVAVDRIGVAANWQASGGWTDGAHRLGTSPEKDVGFPYRSALVPRRNAELDERMTRYSWQSYLIATASFAEWIDRGRPAPAHRRWSQYLSWVADLVGMSVVQPESDLLVLTETGYGKRVALSEFRRKHRGGQGVRLIALEGKKTGLVAAVQQVTEEDEELLLISAGGQVVRTDVTTINRQHAQARGVITMRMNEGDRVVAISAFRAGLAERDAIGDNDSPEPGGAGPDAGSGA